jgi:hypothetical protein
MDWRAEFVIEGAAAYELRNLGRYAVPARRNPLGAGTNFDSRLGRLTRRVPEDLCRAWIRLPDEHLTISNVVDQKGRRSTTAPDKLSRAGTK